MLTRHNALSIVKIILLTLLLGVIGVSGLKREETGAFVKSALKAASIPMDASNWTPDVPQNLGWNLEGSSASFDEGNPNNLDLPCESGETVYVDGSDRTVHNWSDVSESSNNVKYLRHNIRPDGSHLLLGQSARRVVSNPDDPSVLSELDQLSDSYLYNHSNGWGAFGSTEGEYFTRVRAFNDSNQNGKYDQGEAVSDWSDYCSITYDASPPQLPGQPGWTTSMPNSGYQGDGDGLDNYVSCGETITDSSLEYRGVWGEASDDGSGVEKYQRQVVYNGNVIFNGDESDNYTGLFTPGSSGPNGGDGVYYVRVRAIDKLGHASIDDQTWDDTSNFDEWCQLTIDTDAPSSALTVSSSPEKDIEDLDGWQAAGDVSVVTQDALGNEAYAGEKMALVGKTSDPGNEVTVNVLSQEVDNSGHGLRSIGFWYNFMTYETGGGFDDPGFMVFVGDKMVHQVWATSVLSDGDETTIDSSGWQFLSVDISREENPTITLAFYGGNTGDVSRQSFVYLDQVSTNEAVVNSQAEFKVTAEDSLSDATAHYRYYLEGEEISGSGENEVTFSIDAQPDEEKIEYWAEDNAGNKQPHQYFHVVYDDQQPESITDLQVIDEADGEYTLAFTAPSDNVFNPVSEYEVRYSESEFDATVDWDSLQTPVRKLDGVVDTTFNGPKSSGEADEIVVEDLITGETYYFAVKSLDGARNTSEISNIAVVNPPAPSPIVMNEILFDPIGDDSGSMPDGEWVELYNNGDEDVDVSGWQITDAAEQVVSIVASNSDNDLDPSDDGETVVPAKGRLVVYVDGTAIFNNSGDTVTLLDVDGTTIDQHTYTGGKPEGNTESRIEEGTGEWIDPIATPGTPNALTVDDLQPQVKLWQQDDYKARIMIFDAQKYEDAEYIVTYTHLVDDNEISEGVQGSITIEGNGRLEESDIYLATCSEGGEICVPHHEINQVELEVILKKDGLEDAVLQYLFEDDWSQLSLSEESKSEQEKEEIVTQE